MNLLTLSDGHGDSTAVPLWYDKFWKWPAIIKLLTKQVNVINLSRYGAGNEFIITQLQQNIGLADKVIIQWAQPGRLDLLLDHEDPEFWKNEIASDPVYNNNVVTCGKDKFWLSSGSTLPVIQNYHSQYISLAQHQSRSRMYAEYAKLLLEHRNIDYRFMLTRDSEYLDIDAKWVCHEPLKGINSFRRLSKYRDLDLGLAQPIPLIAFDFIKQYIIPSFNLNWRNSQEINAVENMLYRHYQDAVKKQNDSF